MPEPISCVIYGAEGPTEPVLPIPMSRTEFLNAASISDQLETHKWNDVPYVLMGKVPIEDLPKVADFKKTVAMLVTLEEGSFQKKIRTESNEDMLLTCKKSCVRVGKTSRPRGNLYLQTDLTNREALKVAGSDFKKWMEIGGVLAMLFPDNHSIATVGFLFSEKGTVVGIHQEDYKFGSINICFYGEKEWDIFPPGRNNEIVAELEQNNAKHLLDTGCAQQTLHKSVFAGKITKEKFKSVKFVQKPGEVVIIPPGVLHQVHARTNCVAAAYNFVDMIWANMEHSEVTSTCSCLYGQPLLKECEVNYLRQSHIQMNFYAKSLGTSFPLVSTRHPCSLDAESVPEFLLDYFEHEYGKAEETSGSSLVPSISVACEESVYEQVTQKIKNGVSTVSRNGHNYECSNNVSDCLDNQDIETNGPSTEIQIEEIDAKKKMFYCKKCGKKCGSWGLLVRHQNIHNERTFTCPKCEKTFGKLRYLKQHQRLKRCQPMLHDCQCTDGKQLSLRCLRNHAKTCTLGKDLLDSVLNKPTTGSTELLSTTSQSTATNALSMILDN